MITIKNIDILTAEEFEDCSSVLPPVSAVWWLSMNKNEDVCVASENTPVHCPCDKKTVGVRPALTLSIDEDELVLLVGSKIELFGMKWTVVGEYDSDVRVLCNDIIGYHRYHSEDVSWEESELKTWLEDWLAYVAMGLDDVKLASERVPGKVYRIGKYDMILLKEVDGECYMLAKDFYGEFTVFDKKTNEYKASNVDKICQEFATEVEAAVGSESLIERSVDFTSSDGSRKYKPIRRKASLLTLDMFEEYEDILKTHESDKPWWLATPWKDTDCGVSCVSPDGIINGYAYDFNFGVRPFCILKSSILESFG